jgi:glucose uptake protein GlcU
MRLIVSLPQVTHLYSSIGSTLRFKEFKAFGVSGIVPVSTRFIYLPEDKHVLSNLSVSAG